MNVIGWLHTVDYGSLKLAFILYVILRNPWFSLEIISVSEKRIKNCIEKIIDNVFEKNDEGGLFIIMWDNDERVEVRRARRPGSQ